MAGQEQSADGSFTAGALEKATGANAGEIASRVQLNDAAREQLGDGSATPAAFLEALVGEGANVDAIKFLAHALPPREGAWWAATVARKLELGDEQALPRRAVRAAEAWVFDPSEDNAYAAWDLANELGFKHASSWAATAPLWSGDSLAPRDLPKVPPKPYLYCHAVAGAVMLAATEGEGQAISRRQVAYLQVGVEIANGGTGRTEAGQGGTQ